MSDRLRGWLVSLYPRRWRERYAEEFAALLEECLHSPLDALDIALGALDAHLEFDALGNWRLMDMVNKLRTSILIVFAGYIGFVIGGLSLYGLVDDSPAARLMKTDGLLSAAWTTIESGAVISLLAVVLGGLPLAATVIRRALTSSRRDLRLLLVPPAAFLALLTYAAVMASVASGRLQIDGVVPAVTPENFPLGNRLLLGGFMLVFVLGAAASTAAVWRVISNTDEQAGTWRLPGRTLSIPVYEYAYVPALITTLGMLLMLIATLTFGWLAYAALPEWFAADQGLLLTGTSLSYGITILIMGLSTGAALIGVRRAATARKKAA